MVAKITPAHIMSARVSARVSARAKIAIAQTATTPVVETHFAILQLGVSIWNQWRASEPLTRPNLRNANLAGFHLENINLCRADLRQTNLSNAYLYDADFQEADLRGANLARAGLIGANLHKANAAGAVLKQAYLAQSDLSQANFTSARLQKADLQLALLTDTTFDRACLAEAELTGSFDLTKAQLESARGVHLACFDAALKIELGLAPDELANRELADDRLAKEQRYELPSRQPSHSQRARHKVAARQSALAST